MSAPAPDLTATMQSLRARGASYHVIATTLNQHSVRGSHGGRWFAASVRRALLKTVAAKAPAASR